MESYRFLVALLGLALLLGAWLPHTQRGRVLPLPLVYVAIGALLYASAGYFELPLPLPDPLHNRVLTEHLAELAVIISLMSVGLRLDTPFGWRRWHLTWRLLAIAMPLSIASGFLLGQALLGLGTAAALLLGAVLAPTDPVLAADVQIGKPGEGKEDPVRFALSSEAGLNDGLAFPFVWAAIALALAQASGQPFPFAEWFGIDVAWRIGAGAVIGWLGGLAAARFLFRSDSDVSRTQEGIAALAITLLAYGSAELAHGYGFIAVFAAALSLRHYERDHAFHETLELFAHQCERILMIVLLMLFGGAIATGVVAELDTPAMAFALLFVFVVRPLAGLASMLGSPLPWLHRLVIAFFGVRGVGSVYYLAFGLGHAAFVDAQTLWATVLLVIALSLLLHGLTATPVLAWLDRRRPVTHDMPGGSG